MSAATTGAAGVCHLLSLPGDQHVDSCVSPWEQFEAMAKQPASHDPGFCVDALALCACVGGLARRPKSPAWVRVANHPHGQSKKVTPSRVHLSLCSAGEGGEMRMEVQDAAVMQCSAGKAPPACSLSLHRVTFFLPIEFLENLTVWIKLVHRTEGECYKGAAARVRFHLRPIGVLWACITRRGGDAGPGPWHPEAMDLEAVVRCKGVAVSKA